MRELTINLFLCPNEKYKEQPPDPTWPAPGGIGIRLVPTRAADSVAAAAAREKKNTPKAVKGADKEAAAGAREAAAGRKPISVTTNDEGIASAKDIPAGNYTIEATDYSFAGWGVWPKTVEIEDGPKKADVKLFPPAYKWLLPLRLQRYDDGKRVALSSAEVDYPEGKTKLSSRTDGHVYFAVPQVLITLSFKNVDLPGVGFFKPQAKEIRFCVSETPKVAIADIFYAAATEVTESPAARVSVEPFVRVQSGGGWTKEPLIGASTTITDATPGSFKGGSFTKRLTSGSEIIFDNLLPVSYTVVANAPAQFKDWPIEENSLDLGAWYARPECPTQVMAEFHLEELTVTGRVETTDGRLVQQNLQLEIYGDSGVIRTFTVDGGNFSVALNCGVPSKIGLGLNDGLQIDGIPLEAQTAEQPLLLPPMTNVIVLQYKYGVKGQAVDEAGQPVVGAIIDVFDGQQKEPVGSAASGPGGKFIVGTKTSGNYFVAPRTRGGAVVKHQLVVVQSIGDAGPVVVSSGPFVRPVAATTPVDADGDSDSGRRGAAREALTDLASYPVLTEEVATAGFAGPSPAGTGAAGVGSGYGQAVDQVIRDVLGWRPSGDVAGFQAALAGAFQLCQVEGHTEWSWQQRGYAVQADMGALTGAQASIYARAKSALDQILPLLASLTTIDPALYPPQDLEAIRTVITAELQELVGELALEGGPRIQRVDELFGLLLGDRVGSTNLNPDLVQGQLGRLRDRFGLTADHITTVEEERIVTNFRIVVEQLLALQASWSTDRNLLSVVDSRTSLGTILIRLSRGLEAVCESVADLTFALDSVYVDAAQRQVIELRLPNETPLLLSDLLDWVLRASRDEGPRIVQDAGKEGVFAFAPVLDRLRTLVDAAREAARTSNKLPSGMKTPRVDRAFQVLASQITEAATLARLVRGDLAPQLFAAVAGARDEVGLTTVTLAGANFRPKAAVVLIPENREDLPDLTARHPTIRPPISALAKFRIPKTSATYAGVTWLAMLINEDGAESNPVTVQFPNALR